MVKAMQLPGEVGRIASEKPPYGSKSPAAHIYSSVSAAGLLYFILSMTVERRLWCHLAVCTEGNPLSSAADLKDTKSFELSPVFSFRAISNIVCIVYCKSYCQYFCKNNYCQSPLAKSWTNTVKRKQCSGFECNLKCNALEKNCQSALAHPLQWIIKCDAIKLCISQHNASQCITMQGIR